MQHQRKCVLLTVSFGISFGRSKLLQSCRNVTLKPELEPTVGSGCSGGNVFVEWICPNTERLFEAILVICDADFRRQEHQLQMLQEF